MSKALLRTYCACLALFAFYCVNAWAADDASSIKQCAQEKVAFDGIQPLKYADVTGEANSHIPLWHEHPSLCSSTDEAKCKGKAYLIPGNTVAVANTCGDYAHVQYIGEKTVSYGWVEASRLTDRATSSSSEEAENQDVDHRAQHYQFKLTKGHGVPVCEAYLQRLNQTEFSHPAFCGRPEYDAVPGFGYLVRMHVATTEINQLLDLATSIVAPFSGKSRDDYDSMNKNGGVYSGVPNRSGFKFPENTELSSWRYSTPVDIDNDGKPDSVLILGEGKADLSDCVSYIGNNASLSRAGHIAFIMVPNSVIDQAKTIAVFGHPDGGLPTFPGIEDRQGPIKFLKSFRLIGNSYGIFKYQELYYFDTFFDSNYAYGDLDKDRLGDFEDKRIGDPTLKDTLGVFLRKDNKTQQICEYRVTK